MIANGQESGGAADLIDLPPQGLLAGLIGTFKCPEIEYREFTGHVYLGYWVAGSRKMGYKTRFLPQDHLMASGWERFTGEPERD